jgi:hypothetical protein
VNADLDLREIERLRRITNLVVNKRKIDVNAELAEQVGESFWDLLDSYKIPFAELPNSFVSLMRIYRFNHGRGVIAEIPLWEESGSPSDLRLSFLVEFVGDIPRITIENLRIL